MADQKIINTISPIAPTRALFIKLGEKGRWAADCIKYGQLRLGFLEVPDELCKGNKWDEVRALCASTYGCSGGVATSYTNQIRHFYEADETVLWVTFHGDTLWWCFSKPEVFGEPNGEKIRNAQWHNKDIKESLLIKGGLSGKLLAVQGFLGTICSVREMEYLVHKINATVPPHVTEAQNALSRLTDSLIPIIKKLHQNDFEILVDLVFRQAGWQRVGVLGKTEKDIDLDLISPVTGERIAVQVKSRAGADVWRDYSQRFSDMQGFSRFYLVTHSPKPNLIEAAKNDSDSNLTLWGVEMLASQVIRGGLTGWLLDKAS